MSKRSRREKRLAKVNKLRQANPTVVLPPGMREAIQSSLSIKATTQSSSFSGPLPPPEMLKEYDNVLPGAADRIIKMAETQSDHRQKLESKVVSGEVVKSYLGMACGFVVAIAGMSIGGFLLNEGHTIGGSIFAGVPLTGLVTVFVVGATQRRKERETKARILTGTEPIQQAIAK